MKKRMFFLISNKHEYFEFRFLFNRIKNLNIQIFLLIENNIRNSNIEYEDDHKGITIIHIEPINYSKNLLKSYFQKLKIKKSINLLNIKSSDFFIYFNNSSLLFFLLYSFYTEKNCKTIMLLTSGFIVPSKYSKINIPRTIKLNLLAFFIIFKFLKYINFKNSSFKNIIANIKHDFILVLNNSTELLPKSQKFHIESYFKKQKKEDLNTNKSLIILSSFWIDKYKNYNNTIKNLINKLGVRNVVIKDHPSSQLTNTDLQKLYGVKRENVLDNNIDLEKYITSNLDFIKNVFGPTSAALKYSSFMNIPTYCFSSIFMNEDDLRYTNEYFKMNNVVILADLEKQIMKKNLIFSGKYKIEDVLIKILK